MKKKVLILCTGNSCRSQIAEGLMRAWGGNYFDVHSAGVRPSAVNPYAIQVMAEIGIDISSHTSKSAMDFIQEQFDYVITVCDHAQQTCPTFPGTYEKEHWNIEDPVNAIGTDNEILAIFRKTRERIGSHVKDFIAREQ